MHFQTQKKALCRWAFEDHKLWLDLTGDDLFWSTCFLCCVDVRLEYEEKPSNSRQ